MHKISFRMTLLDFLEGYKVGTTHLDLHWRVVWSGILLMFVAGPVSTLLLGGYPAVWLPKSLPPHLLLVRVAYDTSIPLASCFFVTALGWYFTRRHMVSVEQHSLAVKAGLVSKSTAWREVTNIVDTGRYLCFCQNTPTAFVVPKLAFADPQDAEDFYATALAYWRDAKGISPPPGPEVIGIWPPAPRPGNSAEPGDTPSC